MTRIAVVTMAYPGPVSRGTLMMQCENVYTACTAGWDLRMDAVCKQPTDAARNYAVAWATAQECTHLFMADADTYCRPGHAPLATMMGELGNATAIGAAYVLRGRRKVSVSRWNSNDTYPCNMVGAGLLLIDLTRLHALGSGPWFRFVLNSACDDIEIGEDAYFCAEVERTGGTVLATTKLPTMHDRVVPQELDANTLVDNA